MKNLEDRVVYFLCSPNAGILDNWISILFALKKIRPDLKTILVIPKPNSHLQFNLDNCIYSEATKIFDKVLFKDHSNQWMQARNLESYVGANFRLQLNYALNKFYKVLLRLTKAKRSIQKLHLLTVRFLNFDVLIDLQRINFKEAILLYDIGEENKSYNSDFLKLLSKAQKYSIDHGFSSSKLQTVEKDMANSTVKYRKDCNVFTFSDVEHSYYNVKFNIPFSKIKTVGIPRHEREWLLFLQKSKILGTSTHNVAKNKVLIISRPSGTTYFPRERKKKALMDIKSLLIDHLGMFLIIKPHPKERNEGLYEEVFEEGLYGLTWNYSNEHPVTLGSECSFAISFYSGVVLDMLAIDVPCIEYLNLQNLNEHDNEAAYRDYLGAPVFIYRYLGFVMGVSNSDELAHCVSKILESRGLVLSELQSRYNTFFPKKQEINLEIAKQILYPDEQERI